MRRPCNSSRVPKTLFLSPLLRPSLRPRRTPRSPSTNSWPVASGRIDRVCRLGHSVEAELERWSVRSNRPMICLLLVYRSDQRLRARRALFAVPVVTAKHRMPAMCHISALSRLLPSCLIAIELTRPSCILLNEKSSFNTSTPSNPAPPPSVCKDHARQNSADRPALDEGAARTYHPLLDVVHQDLPDLCRSVF